MIYACYDEDGNAEIVYVKDGLCVRAFRIYGFEIDTDESHIILPNAHSVKSCAFFNARNQSVAKQMEVMKMVDYKKLDKVIGLILFQEATAGLNDKEKFLKDCLVELKNYRDAESSGK